MICFILLLAYVESKRTIFNAFIVSNFLYCHVVWHMFSKSDTKKVEKVQERALCFIYRRFQSDNKSLLNLAGCSTLYMDRLRTIVIEVYKAINGMSPEFLQDLFVIKANVHDLKLPSLFAARLFWIFDNKLHNMKALVILSHHDHHFSHLHVFMKNNERLWVPVSSCGVFSWKKTPHNSLFQHRCSYRDLCPNF